GSGCRRLAWKYLCYSASHLLFQNSHDAGDIGIFLSNGDVNAIERPVIFVPGILRCLVQTSLTDDGIDADRGFAGGAIADNELALAPANWNHRINCHDTRLHWLTDAAALDHPGRDFFQRIKCFRFDFSLAIERFPEGVDDATEQPLPYRN